MIYDTMTTPPPANSPIEMVCMYVFNARQRSQYLQTLLTINPPESDERAKTLRDLLESYTQEMFPYHERQKTDKSQTIQQIMEREMARGPSLVQAESALSTSRRSPRQS